MLIQLELLHENYDLIWIDESSLSGRNSNMYGWCLTGRKRYVSFHDNTFSMSFIVAFSRTKLYGIMGVQGTINSLIFGLFLKQLYDVINSNDPESNDRRVLVMDNASIHKSRHIHSLVKGKKARILTICPYEPSLNPAEKLILSIKSKIKTRQFQGRTISLALIKAVIDEVASVRLEGMIDASFKEAIWKIKQISS